MFRALRRSVVGFGQRIGDSWNALRSKGMIRLFLFEFSVVLLGVLAAQALQTMAQDRAANARVDEEMARIDADLALAIEAGGMWQAALPCLFARTESIMRTANQLGRLPAGLSRRPTLWGMGVAPASPETVLAMRARYSQSTAKEYSRSIEISNRMEELGLDIAAKWEQFSRLDPALGEPSREDVAAARSAAADIRADLRSIQILVNVLDYSNETLELEPAQSRDGESGASVRPIADCAEFERENAIFLREDMVVD